MDTSTLQQQLAKHLEWAEGDSRVPLADVLSEAIYALSVLQQELTLIKEASLDPELSDAAVRTVALGLDPPTIKDIERVAALLRH